MRKKFLLGLVVAFFALFAVACGGDRTYKADGTYTAFRWELHSNNGPQLSSVAVTIENDEVKSYYIDCIQNGAIKNEEGVITGFSFNEKSKKELEYDYRMHGPGMGEEEYLEKLEDEDKKEWFEQAELIEAYFLANSPDKIEVDNDNYITNISGVTIKDGGYSTLAKEALELAKEGKTQAFVTTFDNSSKTAAIVFGTAEVDKDGTITSLKLDTIQGKVENGKHVWNEKTKQELGEDYGMAGVGPKYDYKDGEWTVNPDKKSELEWNEQANLITNYVLENGITGLKSIKGQGVSKNGTIVVSGVTIYTDSYFEVLNKLYDAFK